MDKTAASRDRHTGVVKGQEELVGVKEVDHKYVLKRDSTDSIIVVHTKRTNMLFDSEVEAKDAFLNIHDAKDEAEFKDEDETEKPTESEDKDMDNNKSAAFSTGMTVCGKYTIIAHSPIDNTYLLKGRNGVTNWVDHSTLKSLPPAMISDTGFSGPEQKTQVKDPGMGPEGKGSNYPYNFNKFDGYNTIEKLPQGNPTLVGHASESHSLIDPSFPISDTERQLQLGVRREHEHTEDSAKALEIAIDHIAEDPKYYDKLNTVLPEHGEEEKPNRDVEVSDVEEQSIDYEGVGKKIMFPM